MVRVAMDEKKGVMRVNIKCDGCGKEIVPGNRPDGVPNGVGFVLADGKVVNYCAECLEEIGRQMQKDEGGKTQ